MVDTKVERTVDVVYWVLETELEPGAWVVVEL